MFIAAYSWTLVFHSCNVSWGSEQTIHVAVEAISQMQGWLRRLWYVLLFSPHKYICPVQIFGLSWFARKCLVMFLEGTLNSYNISWCRFSLLYSSAKMKVTAYLRLVSSVGFGNKITASASLLQQSVSWQGSNRFGFLLSTLSFSPLLFASKIHHWFVEFPLFCFPILLSLLFKYV